MPTALAQTQPTGTALRRIISVWLPRLPTDRLLRGQRHHLASLDGEPLLAVISEDHRGASLAALSAAAEAQGLQRGQRLTDARALCPTLRTAPATPEQDAALLRGLRRWAGQWTPWVAEDGPDALLLDVSGCGHLFGGEEALLATIHHAFDRLGLSAHIALAETRGAAWAMARYRAPQQGGPVRVAAGETRAALAPLPPAALRLGEEVTESLDRLGLKTIDALLALPRASLARRAGVLTIRRMDQALGAEPEPVCPAAPPPTYAVRQSLPEPLTTLDAVMAVVERLLRRLCQTLETRQEGLRGLRITLRRVDHSDAQTTVGLAKASRDLALILRLCEAPISALKSGFGFEHIRLQADPVEPLALYRQDSLAPAHDGVAAPQQAALESLLSRLGGRLGFDNLLTLRLADTHLPNQRNQWLPWGQSNSPPPAARPPKAAAQRRPLVLFPPEPLTPAQEGSPPAAFRWRRSSYTLASAQGPERIAPPWWNNDAAWRSGLRDYWQVQTAEGPRLWLFHLPQRAALLSGMGEEPSACWFVEGAFP